MPLTITTVMTNYIPGPVELPQSATNLAGFFGATPIVQPAAAAQSAVTTAAITAVTTTGSTSTTPFGFSTSAQADAVVTAVNSIITRQAAIITLLNQHRTDLVALGLEKGAA